MVKRRYRCKTTPDPDYETTFRNKRCRLSGVAAASNAALALTQLRELSASDLAFSLQTVPLRQKLAIESALASLRTGVSFEDLPSDAVRTVAVVCSSSASFAWCATCRRFRKAQPMLRVLLVGREVGGSLLGRSALGCVMSEFRNELMLEIPVTRYLGAHRRIDLMSRRHSSEITHLFIGAWESGAGEGSDALPRSRLLEYGRALTSLHFVDLRHEPRGSTCSSTSLRLSNCAMTLIHHAPLLRSISIFAQVHLPLTEVIRIVKLSGRKLHNLAIECTPFGGFHGGTERDTISLRDAVSAHCRNLRQPPVLLCHYPMPNMNQRPSADWWRRNRPSEEWMRAAIQKT